MRTESKSGVPGQQRVERYRCPFAGDEDILEEDRGDGCTL